MNFTKTRLTDKLALGIVMVAGIGVQVRADLCFTSDPAYSGAWRGSFAWSTTYQAIQQTTTTGGWTVQIGPEFEFTWPAQTTMRLLANSGCGRVTFDLSVHAESFYGGNWTNGSWYQIRYVGNSDGAHAWTQDGAGNVSDTYSDTLPNDHTWHYDLSFARMGWDAGDTWFQIFWGSNSEADKPLQFFINNLCVYCACELGLQKTRDQVVLTWTNQLFTLQSAPLVDGTYINVPGATSPYTNNITETQLFFRLKF